MNAFDHSSSLFEPTSTFGDSSSFLSFSSFADFTPSPLDETLSLWDLDQKPSSSSFGPCSSFFQPQQQQQPEVQQRTPLSTFSSDFDFDSTPSPSNSPFQIISSAFEPTTPSFSGSGDYGILHTPNKAGPFRLSGLTSPSSTATTPQLHHQRSISSEWDSPVTPALTSKSSIESFASAQTAATGYEGYLPPSITSVSKPAPYSWDDHSQSTSLGSSSSSTSSSKLPSPPAFNVPPSRVVSNPSLRAPRHPRVVKQVASMPALMEEEASIFSPSQWFDGTELYEIPSNTDPVEDNLLDDFDWAFGDYGLGESGINDATIFSAFQAVTEQDQNQNMLSDTDLSFQLSLPSSTNTAFSVEMPDSATHTQVQTPPGVDLSWLPEPSTQDFDSLALDALMNDYINPMAVMAPNTVAPVVAPMPVEDVFRPTTAPQMVFNAEAPALLSVPAAGKMMRSVSSESVFQARNAPRDLFSYAPQQLLAGPPAPQPLYTTVPSASFIHMSQAQAPSPMRQQQKKAQAQRQSRPKTAAPSSSQLPQQQVPQQQMYQQQTMPYAPAPFTTGPMQPQAQAMPQAHVPAEPVFTHTQSSGIRRPAAQHLAIEIQQPNFSTYMPPTPDSASFSDYRAMSYQQQQQQMMNMQYHQPPAQVVYQPANMQPVQQQYRYQPQEQIYAPVQSTLAPQPQPITMTRGATQPLPGTNANRRNITAPIPSSAVSTPSGSSAPSSSSGVPAHLLRAQAIVQMQEAKEEAQRQELRRQGATRRVGMADASVMQPTTPPPTSNSYQANQMRQQQQQLQVQQIQLPQQQQVQPINGWEGSSQPTGVFPVLGTAPLVNIHPPPATYCPPPATYYPPGTASSSLSSSNAGPSSSSGQRVHPPPISTAARPMARLPSGSPGKRRQASSSGVQSSPNEKIPKRSPSGGLSKKKAQQPSGGAFSWGETTFINFTPDDAEKLLTGVAPSGSQNKRRREDEGSDIVVIEGLSAGSAGLGREAMDRSKRSRSGEAPVIA